MKIRLSAPLQYESYCDGVGIRMTLWNQGCRLKCPGCHNPETHDENSGEIFDIEEIKRQIKEHRNGHCGITLSGGDPFLQPAANLEIAKYAHSLGLDVWAYCGLTYEELIKDKDKFSLLKECDVLVDGPFILSQRDITLAFRGSKNQRIIDIKKTLEKGEITT